MPAFVPLALATLADAPPAGDRWIHEVKLDGYRIEALLDPRSVRLMSRNAKDWTDKFPRVATELADLLARAEMRDTILDGEIVVEDARGVSSFQLLQQSFDRVDTRRLRYYVFDVLMMDGHDLTDQLLGERLPLLEALLRLRKRGSIVKPVMRFDPRKGDVLTQACRAGEEGVISKRIDLRHMPGRGKAWIKAKCGKRQEFVIVGYTEPRGSRTGFGALLLGVYDGKALVYAGRVGTGFDTATLDALYARLRAIEVGAPPLAEWPAGVARAGVHWVEPTLVAEVAFTEWTDDGLLRHPSFQGLRADKRARDVHREQA